jgi:integrase
MERFDPYKHEQAYNSWKRKGRPIDGVKEPSARLIRELIADMEIGANINPSSKKGARSFGRLRNLKAKMHTMTLLLQTEYGIDSLTDLENQDMKVLIFFKNMREGKYKSRRIEGEILKAVGTYARAFKTFWHWHQRRERKNGRDVRDITIDLDATSVKPKFNYLTIDEVKKMCDIAKYDYRVLMMFLFDSGIRAPTELMNVKVSDLEWNQRLNYYTLTIRQETSKTFGRKIKLLLCSEVLRDYLNRQKLPSDSYIFKKIPQSANQYLKSLGYRVLGRGVMTTRTYNNKKYDTIVDGLSMYDFRHSSACYWLPRYKSESALKYRFGWKKSDMIFYYTELLGMSDNIESEDLYIDISKTELEQQINKDRTEIELLREEITNQDAKMKEIIQIIKALELEKMVEARNIS